MLRPIAENPFADRQIAEFQFAEFAPPPPQKIKMKNIILQLHMLFTTALTLVCKVNSPFLLVHSPRNPLISIATHHGNALLCFFLDSGDNKKPVFLY
jgi:hypothetical protein